MESGELDQLYLTNGLPKWCDGLYILDPGHGTIQRYGSVGVGVSLLVWALRLLTRSLSYALQVNSRVRTNMFFLIM